MAEAASVDLADRSPVRNGTGGPVFGNDHIGTCPKRGDTLQLPLMAENLEVGSPKLAQPTLFDSKEVAT